VALNIWPCHPDDYGEIDKTENILSFLLTGMSTVLGHPVAILYVKKDGGVGRVDPMNPSQNYRDFCSFFMGDEKKGFCGLSRGEAVCQASDERLFRQILRDNSPDFTLVEKPCNVGVMEVMCPISVNGVRAVFFMGQFRPKNIEQVKIAVQELGKSERTKSIVISHLEKDKLMDFSRNLPELNEQDRMEFLKQCKKINEFVKHTIERERLAFNEKFSRELTEELVKIETPEKDFVKGLHVPLEYICEQLSCLWIALFAAPNERDNILRLRSSYGLPKDIQEHPPHFNWSKGTSALPNGPRDESLLLYQEKNDVCEKGFRQTDLQCKPEFFKESSGIVLSCRVRMPKGIFIFGPFSPERKIYPEQYKRFLIGIGYRILIRTNAHDMTEEAQKDATAKRLATRLTIHRIKQIFQSLKSYLDMVGLGIPFEKAKTEMIANINRLDDIAKRAVSVRRYEIDRGKLYLEKVRLGDVLYAAIDDQQEFADKNRCEIQVEISLGEDARIRIDFALMRIAFVCLLNNAIKYSLHSIPEKPRTVNIKTGTILNDAYVEFENFGLGILKFDYERVFEEGVHCVPSTGEFAYVGGEGLGLFDARKIVVAHEGRIEIHSCHHDGKPVLPENISRCVTKFRVRLPREK